MNTTCPKCGTAYDISAYKPGQRLRCRCGQIIVKPQEGPRSHVARTFHCSACGGSLEKGREDCPYCGSVIDMTNTRMTAYCASCLGMSKEGATFCSECGKPLAVAIDTPEDAKEQCPRCKVGMRRRVVGRHRPLECPMCCGLFVEAPDLERMIRDQEQRFEAEAGGAVDRPRKANPLGGPVAYLKCPVCESFMNRVNYGRLSGVIIDWCGDHGYWLDPGELEKIAQWVATGGLRQKHERDIGEYKARRKRIESGPSSAGVPMIGTSSLSGNTRGFSAGGGVLGLIAGLFDP